MLWLLVACAPPGPWSRVAVLCDLGGEPSPDCADALAEDFGVDPAFPDERREAVIAGLFLAAGADLGAVLGEGGFVPPAMARALRSDLPPGPAAYELMAGAIDVIAPATFDDPYTLAAYGDGSVMLDDDYAFSPAELPAVLFHEARHARGPDHVPCPEGVGPSHEQGCDEASSGSYGFQAAYDALRAEAMLEVDPLAAATLEARAWDARSRILSP